MTKLSSSLTSLALVACLAAGASSAQAQIYSVKDAGVLNGKKMSSPAALSNNGQVAGVSFSEGADTSAFLAVPGKDYIQDLGDSTSVSRAYAMNELGMVVGTSTFGGTAFRPNGPSTFNHAALFANGSAYDLGSLTPGEFSRAAGINSQGQVVGFSGANENGTDGRAFLWRAGIGMIDMGTLGGASAQATAINEAGFVTGNSAYTEKSKDVHAFLVRADSQLEISAQPMMDLGTLGGTESYGTALNANNHVVGYSSTEDGRIHAFLYNGKMTDLGSLGEKSPQSDQSVALGVNSADQVVGYSYLPVTSQLGDRQAGATYPAQQVAFLAMNGVMRDLNRLIGDAAKHYLLLSAVAINEAGEILVNAQSYDSGAYHALVLSPSRTTPPLPMTKAKR